MAADQGDEDFLLRVEHVLTLRGRGTVVAGTIERGVLTNDDAVEVWGEGQLIARARAAVELVCRTGGDGSSIGLRLHGVDKDVLSPGQTVRHPG